MGEIVPQFVIDLPDQPCGLVGPFTSKELADSYADSTLGEIRWEVRELHAPSVLSDIRQRITDALREIYGSDDYARICPHCHDANDSSWANNIAELVVAELETDK